MIALRERLCRRKMPGNSRRGPRASEQKHALHDDGINTARSPCRNRMHLSESIAGDAATWLSCLERTLWLGLGSHGL